MKQWNDLNLEQKVARTAATGALWLFWLAILTAAVVYLALTS